MSSTIAGLNLVASEWAGAVGRACWQGGLAIALVWALCRLLPRLPGRVQCWLWRLAYLKLLVALLWGAPLCLPLLPSPPKPMLPPPSLLVPAGEADGQGVEPAAPPMMMASAGDSLPTSARARRPNAAGGLLLLWLLGVAGVGAQVLGDWRRTQRLRIQGGAVRDEALLADCRALSRRFGVRQEPALLTAEDLSCPVLVGVVHPAVLMPASFPAQFTPAQMRLMLAHELAHLKRRDLLWAWLPSLARVLFFFHPLVWLAEGEWRLAQEMACDEQVVLSTGTSQARYGAMLLEVMGEPRRSFPASLLTAGVAESYTTIRRRLVAIQQVRAVSRQRWALASLFLAAAGTAAVIPWRLTVRPAAVNLAASRGEIAGRAGDTMRQPDRRGSETSPPRVAAARQQLPQRGDRLPEPAPLARFAVPHLQPARGPRSPEQFRSAAVPSTGASHSSAKLARVEADRRDRTGLIAGQPNEDPSLTVAQDASGVDTPPSPMVPGPKDGLGKQPPHESFETADLPSKEPSSVLLLEKLREESLSRLNSKEPAFWKEPGFRKRSGISGILLMPKRLASKASLLGWSPSPLLRRRERLTLRSGGEIDPRDLKKMLAQARQEGIIDPKLAEQMRWIDPRVLKKILAEASATNATDARLAEDEKRMALKKSLAEAHRREAPDTKFPDAKWMLPPDQEESLKLKALDLLKRPAEGNRTEKTRRDRPVDEGAPDR
jgi:beta-lactamase regulating signal transducer with metallopeptidase domain